MAELHYIADDLGFDRNWSSFGEPLVQRETWLDDADVELHAGVLERLRRERKVDELDG